MFEDSISVAICLSSVSDESMGVSGYYVCVQASLLLISAGPAFFVCRFSGIGFKCVCDAKV